MRARHRHWRIPSRGCAQIRRTRPSAPPGPRWRRAAPILPLVRVHHRREAPLMLGLPERTQACLFDLDGVLTRTATVHASAWAQALDEVLRVRAARAGEPFVPFDPVRDYDRYVDGLPRADGARRFLASRGIALPEGGPDDRRVRRRSRASRAARTTCSSASSGTTACRRTRTRSATSARPGAPDSGPRWCRRAATAARCSPRRASPTCSTRGSTACSPRRGTCPASRHRTRTSPPRRRSASRRRGARCSRTRSPGSRRAGPAGFGWVVGVDRLGQADALRRHGADVVVTGLAAPGGFRDPAPRVPRGAVGAPRDRAAPRHPRADRVAVRALERPRRAAREPRRGRAARPPGHLPRRLPRAAPAAVRRGRLRLPGRRGRRSST